MDNMASNASTTTTATAVPPSPRDADNLMASYPPQMPVVVMLDTASFSTVLHPALDSMRPTPVVTEAAPAPSSAAASVVCPSVAKDEGMVLDMGMSLGDHDDGLPSMRMDDMDVDASEQARSWSRSSTDHLMSPSDSVATPTPATRERGGDDLAAATFTEGLYEHTVRGGEPVFVMQPSGGGGEDNGGTAMVDLKQRSEVAGADVGTEQSSGGADSVEGGREEEPSSARDVGGPAGDGDDAEEVDKELLAMEVLSHDTDGVGQQPALGSEFVLHHHRQPEDGGEGDGAGQSGSERDHEPSEHYDGHEGGQIPQQQPPRQEEGGPQAVDEDGGGETEVQVEGETNGGGGVSGGGDDSADDVPSTHVHAEAVASTPAHVQPTSLMHDAAQPAETPGDTVQIVNLQQLLSLDSETAVKVEPEDKDDDDEFRHADSPPDHAQQQQQQHHEGSATATGSTTGANTAAAVGRTFNGRFCRRNVDEAGARAAAAEGRTLRGRSCRSNMGDDRQAGGAQSSGSEKFSQHRGVRWSSGKGKWVTEVKAFGKVRYYAEFDDEEKAARAYDREVQKDLSTPTLNFPDDVEHENESEAGTLTDSSDDDDNDEEEEEEEEDREEAGVGSGRGGGGAFEVKREKPSTPAVRRKSCGGAPASSQQIPLGKSSIYRGVCRRTGTWWVRLRIHSSGKELKLGPFFTEVQAAKAYDEAAKEHRDNPVLNFKPNGSLNPDRHAYRHARANNRHDGSNGSSDAKKSSSPSSSSATNNRASAASSTDKHHPKRHPADKQPISGRSHPRYRGVYRRSNGWIGVIYHKGEKHDLGHFKTDTEAARAYDRAAKQLHGDAAVLNLGRREKKLEKSAATTGAKAQPYDSKKRKRYSSGNEADTTTTTAAHTRPSPPPSPHRPPKRACTQSLVSYAPPPIKAPATAATIQTKATAHTHSAKFPATRPAKPVAPRSSSCTTTTRAGTATSASSTASKSSPSSKPSGTTTTPSSTTAAKLASAREKERDKEDVARATKKARGLQKDAMQSVGRAAKAATSSTSSPPPPSPAPPAAAADATALPLHQTQHVTESGAATASNINGVELPPPTDRDLVAELRAAVMAAWADAEESEWGKYSRAAAPLVQSQEAKQSIRLFLHGLLGSTYSKIDMTKPQDRDRVVRMYLVAFEAGGFST